MLKYNAKVPNHLDTRSDVHNFVAMKNRLLQTVDRCGIDTKTDIKQIEKRFKEIAQFANNVPLSFELISMYLGILEIYNEFVGKRKLLKNISRPTRVRPRDLQIRIDKLLTVPLVHPEEITIRDNIQPFVDYTPKFGNIPMEFHCAIDHLVTMINTGPITPANAEPSTLFKELATVIRVGAILVKHRIY